MTRIRRTWRLALAGLLLASGGPGLEGCTSGFSSDCAEAGESCASRGCCPGLQCFQYTSGGIMGPVIVSSRCGQPDSPGALDR